MSAVPQTNENKIKHFIFHILNIPVHYIESTDAWIEREDSKLVLKIKTDVNNVRRDWNSNVHYIKDATNVTGSHRVYTFRVPAANLSEVETLHNIVEAPEGVMNKDDTINRITSASSTAVKSS